MYISVWCVGQSCAMLGKAMGMKIIGVRRRVDLSDPNSIADKVCSYMY